MTRALSVPVLWQYLGDALPALLALEQGVYVRLRLRSAPMLGAEQKLAEGPTRDIDNTNQ